MMDTLVMPAKERKSSVTFDLPPADEEQLLPFSPTIDIRAQLVPDSMLVALYDRSTEMRDLVKHNKQFSMVLQNHLGSKWSCFENTLYCERALMPDIEWMKHISKALHSVPSVLEKFKELVGYLGEEEETEDFGHVVLSRIRSMPDKLSEEAYPQFYINCQEQLSSKNYKELQQLLFSNQVELSDQAWQVKLGELLKPKPNLLEQLQTIVAYELEEE
jgi:hypothetical protein